MASTDNPISPEGGYFQILGPTIGVDPAPADQPGPLPTARAADQIGESPLTAITDPPGV
jgi:hypothetical protein